MVSPGFKFIGQFSRFPRVSISNLGYAILLLLLKILVPPHIVTCEKLSHFCHYKCIVQVKPAEHKLVLQVFDENRLTRDDFLGMVELTLLNLPKEQEGRAIPPKQYILRPRRLVMTILNALK